MKTLDELYADAENDAGALEIPDIPRSPDFYPGTWALFQITDALDPDPPRWVCSECLAARADVNEVRVLTVAPASDELHCQDCADGWAENAAHDAELRRLPR